MRIGVHISIAGGMPRAVARAQAVGSEAIQVFSTNPRGWKVTPFREGEAEEFRRLCRQEGIAPVFIHSPYLINLSANDAEIYRKSLAAFRLDLARADLLGADGYVIHMGYHRGEGKEAGLKKMIASLQDTFAALPDLETTVLLENTASAGSSLGHRFVDIARVIEGTGAGAKLGLCLDTCHAFVAGYDLATSEGLEATLAEIDHWIGLEKLGLVHFNDSKYGLGSRRDRHEHIGQGQIGGEGMRRIAQHPALQHLPFILETPKQEPDDDRRNLALAKEFRRGINSASLDASGIKPGGLTAAGGR